MVGPVNRVSRNILTGKLFAKLTSPAAAKIQKMGMRYGVSMPYARSVQFGDPMRPFIGKTIRIMNDSHEAIMRRMDRVIDEMSQSLGRSREEIVG
jgi:hypothetical protein